MTSLALMRDRARSVLDNATWEYLEQGAGSGVSRAMAQAAWQRIALRPRVLQGVSEPKLATSVLGSQIAFPVMAAPTGRATRFNCEGELAMAAGAQDAGTLAILPSSIAVSFSSLRERLPRAILWQQLYPMKDRAIARDLLASLRGSGCGALVLTVDLVPSASGPLGPAPMASWERREILPPALAFASATVDDLAWLCSEAGLPVVVKGVLHPEDAALFKEAGASALVVSNHGGNQIDTVVSTARALPEIVDAAGGCEVYVDGGILDGASVFKALAIGARAVLVGRPTAYSLAAGGRKGVSDMLGIFRDDLARTMALCGTSDLARIDRTLVILGE